MWHPVRQLTRYTTTFQPVPQLVTFWSPTQILTVLLLFFNCIVPMRFLPREIWDAFPRESQLRQSRTTQPTVHAGCFSISIIHRTPTWTTGSLTCAQMLMHAVAHRGCTDTRKRVCTESWLWKKNPLPHHGIKPTSAGWRSDALTNWATSPLLNN